MDDLKIIKKKYGEKMMHLCRELFHQLLESPGLLSSLMLEHFEPSKFLYDDIIACDRVEEFKNFIYSFIDVEKDITVESQKTPQELLSEAGYDLYECHTEEDIQYFKKYYAPREELCTFRGRRLETCYVFFAVKKNVQDIKRENFTQPIREDEYGTSVISIQFRRTSPNTLSIKNRYNHTVNNPDNTFGNNLDNIIPGLNESFRRQYNLKFTADDSGLEIPGYVNVNGKFYKYNYEINNIYYCPNNIIIDHFRVIDTYSKESERYIVLDYFIVDLKEKTIKPYVAMDLDYWGSDSFGKEFTNIENIVISKNKETGNKTLEIIYDGGKKATIVVNNTNQMIEYHNENLIETNYEYLSLVEKLTTINVPNLTRMGNRCFCHSHQLTTLNIPNLTVIGSACFSQADNLTQLYAPKLTKMGNVCFKSVEKLKNMETPSLIEMGNQCIFHAPMLSNINITNLQNMGENCFWNVTGLTRFVAPNLKNMGKRCLSHVNYLEIIDIPQLTKIKVDGIERSYRLKHFNAPNLREIDFWGCELLGIDFYKYVTSRCSNLLSYTDAYNHYVKPEEVIESDTISQEPIINTKLPTDKLKTQINKVLQDGAYIIKQIKRKIENKMEGRHNR